MEKGNQNSLYKYWKEKITKKEYRQSDIFFVEKMLSDRNEKLKRDKKYSEEERRKAYQIFREKTDRKEIASSPTMHKWFGIGGYSEPRRDNIFEIGFLLKLTFDELQEYLVEGIREYGIQINDYREMIFMYGILNQFSYEKCLDMIEDFEEAMAEDVVIQNDFSTLALAGEFQMKKNLSEDEFMQWMKENVGAFKGYSNTALECLRSYRRTILKSVRGEMEEYLNEQLEEIGYSKWRAKKGNLQENEGEVIRKYMYSHKKISKEQRKEILKSVQCVYFDEESNARLLAEVFSAVHELKPVLKKKGNWNVLRRMTEKRLSDLLNVSIQKEREIRTSKAERELKKLEREGQDNCPEWIAELIVKYDETAKICDLESALFWIKNDRAEHRRRCLMVEREDILPFVLYVAQHRYLEKIQGDMENYDCKKAKKEFVELADQTLATCNMTKLSSKWELDAVLLACYQSDDMYSYAEALDVMQEL